MTDFDKLIDEKTKKFEKTKADDADSARLDRERREFLTETGKNNLIDTVIPMLEVAKISFERRGMLLSIVQKFDMANYVDPKPQVNAHIESPSRRSDGYRLKSGVLQMIYTDDHFEISLNYSAGSRSLQSKKVYKTEDVASIVEAYLGDMLTEILDGMRKYPNVWTT